MRGKHWREEFLIARLADSDVDRRREAAARLEHMEYDEFSDLIAAAAYQFRFLRKSRHWQSTTLFVTSIASLLVIWLVWLRILFGIGGIPSHSFLPVLSFTVTLLSLLLVGNVAITSRQQRLTQGLAQIDDLRVVSLLAEAHRDPSERDIEQALIRLLPRLRASDANLLTASNRQKLCLMLVDPDRPLTAQNQNLIIAILQAFEQVGDGEAVPFVQSLIQICGDKPAYGRVREAAEACLPFLQARAEQAKAGYGLLRAAHAPVGDLLRPSHNIDQGSPEALLRAASAGEKEH